MSDKKYHFPASLRFTRETEEFSSYRVLASPFLYRLNDLNQIRVPAGFATDGASIPKCFHFWLPPWSPAYAGPAVIHDWLYFIQDTSRKKADRVMLLAMKHNNESFWKRQMIHKAVRAGGFGAWKSHQNEEYPMDILRWSLLKAHGFEKSDLKLLKLSV